MRVLMAWSPGAGRGTQAAVPAPELSASAGSLDVPLHLAVEPVVLTRRPLGRGRADDEATVTPPSSR